jgi:hypothetical protein
MNMLRKYIRRILIEATEYNDKFKELMVSGYDGIKQAIELAESMGLSSQDLPWDHDTVIEYMLYGPSMAVEDVLLVVGWSKKKLQDEGQKAHEEWKSKHDIYGARLQESVKDKKTVREYIRKLIGESRFKQMSKSKFADIRQALAGSSFLDADPEGDGTSMEDWSSESAAKLRDDLNNYFDNKFGAGYITTIVKVDMMGTSDATKDDILKNAVYYFEDGLHFIELLLANIDDGTKIKDVNNASDKVYEVLLHELLHMQQFLKFSKGAPTDEKWDAFMEEYKNRGGSSGMGSDYFFYDQSDGASELETFSLQIASELVNTLGKDAAVKLLQSQHPDYDTIKNSSASFRDIERRSSVDRPEFREMLKRAKQYAKRMQGLQESTEQSATDEERDKMLYLFFAESSRMGIQLAEMLSPETAKELVDFVAMVDMFIEMGESLLDQKKAGDYGSLARLRSIWFEIRTASTKMAKGQSGKVVDAEYLWSVDLSGVFGAIDMVLSSTFITWDPEHQELLDDLKEWARQ